MIESERLVAQGDELLQQGRFSEFCAFAHDAEERFPDSPPVLLQAAAAAVIEGDPDRALDRIRRVTDLAWGDPDLLTWAGLRAFELGDHKTAKRCVRRAAELDPEGGFDLAVDWIHLSGRLQFAAGNKPEAERALSAAFESGAWMPGYGLVLAQFLLEEGRVAEATDVVCEALSHLPDDPDLLELRREIADR